VSSAVSTVNNKIFEVYDFASISAAERNDISTLLLSGTSFDLHGRVVKDTHGTVVYVTSAKNAYVYKGVTNGSIVWSQNIAPKFSGIYPTSSNVKFGSLLSTAGLVGPEADLANQSVPIIGYLIHYNSPDKAAWLAIDVNANTMYKLEIIGGVPYKVTLFGPQSEVMSKMVMDLAHSTVSFNGSATASSTVSSVSSVSSSSSSSYSSSTVIAVDSEQACIDSGGTWDIDWWQCNY